MKIDLHNHTKRCNHASGECEEYVKAAITQGIDIFGFADHAPMDFDEKYRMSVEEIESYSAEVLNLREKYREKIDIRLGFEVDYIHKKEYLIKSNVMNAKVDYLIGSVHFLNNWGFDNEEFLGEYEYKNIDEVWIEYLESIVNMAQSGLFDIVGHFDLLKIFNHKPQSHLFPHIKMSLEAIKDNDMVVEINTAGLRKMIKEIYPSREILELCYKLHIPITFSSDAHSPSQVGFRQDEAIILAKQIGFREMVAFKDRKKEIFSL